MDEICTKKFGQELNLAWITEVSLSFDRIHGGCKSKTSIKSKFSSSHFYCELLISLGKIVVDVKMQIVLGVKLSLHEMLLQI